MQIDLNCDMGEGMPNDHTLMAFISSANIACGFHAGNEYTMQQTIAMALQHGVAIGAHPGFPDKENFGRTPMQLSDEQITSIITEQVSLLMKLAEKAGTKVEHVKPHGALYNMSATSPQLALTIAEAIHAIDPSLILMGLSNSCSTQAAALTGLTVAHEAFADRHYLADGSLVPRSHPQALIDSELVAAEQMLQMITRQSVTPINGDPFPLKAETICIHGDGPHAVAFAQYLQQQLHQHNIEIKSLKQ